jgi:chloramphenicol-sensitive protein RarD
MTERRKGALAMGLACIIWGLSALYYKLIAHVPPLEVLSHRTLWSLVFFVLILGVRGRFGEVWRMLADRRAFRNVAGASLLVSVNWFFYIYAVQVGRVVESSLGYFIFPLVAVALGYLVLGERLRRVQWLAVLLAALAVVVLTLGLGVAPWISLILAITMGFYGLLKKSLPAGPVVSVAGEVVLLAPLAILWLWGVNSQGWTGLARRPGGYFGADWQDSLVLMFSGPITALPLVLMSYATKRMTLAGIGLLQYLNPTLQFLVATLLLSEPFTRWHAIAFGMIWLGLGLFSWEAWRQDRS